jgi:MoaA/NifB/PqqE/SkfB family radical SAM enzyme
LYLVGGEPLLHPDIINTMIISRKYFKVGKIVIYTNGILLLKQSEKFWDECRKNKIFIVISEYPISLDKKAIKQKAAQHKVKLNFLDTSKFMNKVPLDLDGKQDIRNSFKHCHRSNFCVYLDNGKLYTCTLIPTIKHFNSYFNKNLEVSDSDYIDIYQAKNINEIMEFLCQPVPFCRFCKINSTDFNLTWATSKKEISEWV